MVHLGTIVRAAGSAGTRAVGASEPRQIREEAAL